MRVIVAGGRDFNNYQLMDTKLREYLKSITEIVSGAAKGADSLGALWGSNNNIPVKYFPAEWDKYGKSAGFIRNHKMAEYADFLIAFWDGKSHGTRHMIETMKSMNKHGIIIMY